MTKLVCFDLDDTLIQEIHSVMFLCMLNDKLDQLLEIENLENRGELHWIEADHRKAILVQGLPANQLEDGFVNIMRPLSNIHKTIAHFKKRDIQSIIITAGPKQVARVAQDLWGFDASYGSDYEVLNGVFSGKILEHMGDKGKVFYLQEYCRLNNISSRECIAVGDGSTDIPLFEYCHTSIAINASSAAIEKATYSMNTQNLLDIIQFI